MEIVLRSTGLLFFALFCFRIMGYRSMGDLEPMDFVIVLGIAEILGAPLADMRIEPTNAYIAISTLTLFQLILAWASLKNKTVLKLLEGMPIPVIQNGQLLEKNLKKARVNHSDLMEELRVQGLTNYHDVESAFLEPSGRFSIIRKKEVEPITPRYLGRSTSLTLVDNGQVAADKLAQAGITPAQLSEILTSFDIKELEQVDSVVITPSGHIALTKKQ